MLPLVLDERLVHSFNFYLNSQVQQGMRHDSILYGLVSRFPANNRLQAYQLSCQLATAGVPVVTTVSDEEYKVWVDLSTPVYLDWQVYLDKNIGQGVASAS